MVNRRVFLKSSGMALVTLGFAPTFVARAAEAAGTQRKLLVTIFQRGAVDGLNMVVPFGDGAYYQARPSIAIARPGLTDGVIDLNGFFGLHPRMTALKPLWDSRVASVFSEAGIALPTGTWMQSGGKTGTHSEHLGYILAEMQYMQRAYPGMEW